MLRQKILICDDCFHYIAKKSAPAASLWSKICASIDENTKIKNPGFSQHDDLYTVLQKEGFIVSTEKGKKSVAIILYGYNPDKHLICVKKHLNHEKKGL